MRRSRAVLGVAIVLLAGGWTTPARAADCASLGRATDFDVFSHGNYVASTTTLPGRAAAAGNITVSQMSIGASASGGEILVAGGNLSGTNGTVYGGVRYGGTLTADQSFNITGQRTHAAPPFSFDDEFARLAQLSSELGERPDTPGVHVALNQYSHALEITTSDASQPLYVVTIDGDTLAQAAGFNITLPAGSTAVINVTDPNVSLTQAQYMNLSGITASHIVWNFVGVSDFTLGGSVAWQGTLLAPNTRVTDVSYQNLNGQVIAKDAQLNHLTILQAAFSGCLPVPPQHTMQLDALCVDAAGHLSFRARNIGTRDVAATWEDLDSPQHGSFTLIAQQDRYFSLDAGDGKPHTVRLIAGSDTVEATGQPRPCRAQITVLQQVIGNSPGGTWENVLSGSAGVVHSEALAAGQSFTKAVQGGFVDGSVPIGQIPGGAVYDVTQPDPRGGTTIVSESPITVTDGDEELVIVLTVYRVTPPIVTPTPTPTPAPTPEPPEVVEPGQPTLPPGAPDPPPGPDLVGGGKADLAVVHTVSPRRFRVGRLVSITVRVRNLGSVAAAGTVLRELPQYPQLRASQVARITSLHSSQGSCRRARPARCLLGTVPPGRVITLRGTARVLVLGALHSVVWVSSTTPESNTSNNESIADLTSARAPILLRARVTAPAGGRVGERFAYRVTVSGVAPAGARLCTRMPSALTSRSAPGTFLYRGMRCRDYSSLRGSAGFSVSGVPTAGGVFKLPALATAVGTARTARDVAPARISVAACAAVRMRC